MTSTERLDANQVLQGSGRTKGNARVCETIVKQLPVREAQAVLAWLSCFYGYQQTWLLDPSRFSILLKCRQIGASHTYGGAAALWGVFGQHTTVVSVGQREAEELLEKVGHHCNVLHQLGSKWAKPFVSKTRVAMGSKATVVAVPSSSGGRGRSGNVVLDEAAYHEHPEAVWDGASATVLHGFRMRVMSTPNGVGNLFHQLFNDPSIGFRKHIVTLDDARADGLKVSDAECWKMARGDARLYDQLFNCKFLDGDAQYIPTELVNASIVDDVYGYEGEYYAGLDIGRTADRTVIVVVRADPYGLMWVTHVKECKRTSQDDIDAMVDEVMGVYQPKRLCVDSTGIGAFPAESLQKRYGRTRVEPVVFTTQSKEDLATSLFQAFVEGRPRMLREHQRLRDDICSLRRIITSAGNVRYDAPHTSEGHADSAWAFALAIHAAVRPQRRKFDNVIGAEEESY